MEVGLINFICGRGRFLIMEARCKKVIYYYFKNLFQNTIIKAVLFTAVFVLACVFNGIHAINLILLVCGAASIAIDYNLFRLYFKVKRDIKQGEVVSENILIKQLAPDNRHNYYKRDGSVKGNDKYVLTDSLNRQYLFCLKKHDKTGVLNEDEDFNNVRMQISYLPESKLILSMDCNLCGKAIFERLPQYFL